MSRSQKPIVRPTALRENIRVWSAKYGDAGLVDSEYVRIVRESGHAAPSKCDDLTKLDPCGTSG